MLYYEDEIIEVDGKLYSPTTDVIHESDDGFYTNVIADSNGKKFIAYYSQEHYNNDDWSNPIMIAEKLEGI